MLSADLKSDPHRLALLSDTHIAADPAAHERDVVMYDHLKQVCAEVLRLDPRPAAVLINGDCAYHKGFVEDYRTLVELLRPVREQGLPLHLTMGNHDERAHLWQTIEHVEEHVDPLPQRQTVVLEMPRANLFMLDSLDQTDHTPGVLGQQQIQWLGAALDARKDKPAIVMVHHQPDQRLKVSGLTDTQALLDAILPRRQVKALFYGHTHHWDVTQRDNMHCINLPAVAYVFTKGDPSGWVDAHLKEDGMSLELRCIDTTHPKHGEKVDLTWRT
jgi:Icc protein